MRLTTEQSNAIEDDLLSQPFLGNIVEEIRGADDSVSEQRWFLAYRPSIPECPVTDGIKHTPYCVLRWSPLKGFVGVWYYPNHLTALQDNAEFPVRS